jgi:hypothetical protein
MEAHFKARNTIIDMLIDRKYTTHENNSNLEHLRLTIDEFKTLYNETSIPNETEATPAEAYDITGLLDKSKKNVYVLFLKGRMSESGDQKTFRKYLEPALKYFKAGDNSVGSKPTEFMNKFAKQCHIIMVYSSPLNDDGVEKTSKFEKEFKDVENFSISKLGFNITNYKYMGSTPQPINAQPMFTLFRKRTTEWLEIVHRYGSSTENENDNYKNAVNSMNRILVSDPISKWYGATSGDIFKIVRGGRRLSYRLVALS